MAADVHHREKPILECRGVAKRFGGVDALHQVTFSVCKGEVFGVVGPNGAGKTTLFDVICGQTRASAGAVLFHGRDITQLRAHRVARAGLQRTFQTPVVFPELTVDENLQVAAHFGAVRRSQNRKDARIAAALDLCGLSGLASVPAGPLPVLRRKQLMIATALAAEPQLLLLDEPMGGLNHEERANLLAVLHAVAARGITLLVIEHVLSALVQLVSRVLILDHGRAIFEGTPDEMVRDPEVVRVYLGQEAERLLRPGAVRGRNGQP